MRLLKYSICKVCGKTIEYKSKGRPREYCEECKEYRKLKRRIYMTKYMITYRKKLRKILYS
jgi:predicted nucleic acid-binding Zn ribbon protein